MRRFYAPPDAFDGGRVSLSEEEARHLRSVLRMVPGDRVRVFDGEGLEFICEIAEITRRGAELRVIESAEPPAPESPLRLILAAAVTKGDKFDLVIQKAVELGVSHFVPLITARCDVKLRDVAKRHERWNKVVLEASKQSGRATLMPVDMPISLDDLLREASGGQLLFFSEAGGNSLGEIDSAGGLTAVVGPEGGWDPAEIEAAKRAKALVITLAGRVLRAETAAIAIAAILQHRFGDLS